MISKILTIRDTIKNTPSSFFVLFYTETCELFGRFGITALLVLYLTKAFHFSDTKAFTIYGSFIALLFITPVIGGVLSDRFLGKGHSIILGGIVMGIGNLILALNQPQQVYLWLNYRCYR